MDTHTQTLNFYNRSKKEEEEGKSIEMEQGRYTKEKGRKQSIKYKKENEMVVENQKYFNWNDLFLWLVYMCV